MNCIRNFSASSRFHLLLMLTVFLFTLFPGSSNADDSAMNKILVFPCKITTLQSKQNLEKEVDQALSKALASHGIATISRQEARQILDYTGTWPPATSRLTSLPTFSHYSLFVLANVTEIGDKVRIDGQIITPEHPETILYFSEPSEALNQLPQLCKRVASQIAHYEKQQDIIVSIAPTGNHKIDSGAILKNIHSKVGDFYDTDRLSEDLKSIYAMGYFDDIQIEVHQETAGKAVTFKVKEKPVISHIVLKGLDKLKEKDIKDVMTSKEQSVVNSAQIAHDVEAIKTLYKSKGYYNTKVTTDTTYPTPDQAKVTFTIDEGKKIYIRAIRFEGNETFDDDTLVKEMKTSTKGWFSWITSSGVLDKDKLNQDTSRILEFYGNHGFLDAKIGDPVIKQEEDSLFISFAVEEGTRYKVGTVTLEGDLIQDKTTMLAMLATQKGQYLSKKTLREDLLKITDLYSEKGYANASIRPHVFKASTPDTLDVTIEITKGELVYINRINLKGNNRTRDNVIRRSLKVTEGDVFNTKAVRESVQKLQYLEYFDSVNITPSPTFDENSVDLNVDVTEKNTGSFSIGVGYSTSDNLLLNGSISENNFLGTGDVVSFSADIGDDADEYNIIFKNPRVYDTQLSFKVNPFKTYHEYDDYTKDSTGASVELGYPIWQEWRAYGSYTFTDTDLSDIDDDASYIIRNSVDIHTTSAVELTLVKDTRDRQYGASTGHRHVMSVTYAGGPFGGESEFTKVEASTSWFFPLPWSTVFHVKGAAGQVWENEDDCLPVYERFFLGGMNSIRGFESGDVSPKDPDTDESIGGDKMWYSNWEYIFPLFADVGIKGLVFYDMGYVFDDDEDWSLDEIRKSVGMGIRWYSPMGPLRLEWGYNLDPQDDEDDSVWDFSIGGMF